MSSEAHGFFFCLTGGYVYIQLFVNIRKDSGYQVHYEYRIDVEIGDKVRDLYSINL